MAALNFPNNPTGQTPTNTFSPTSTPEASTNGLTYLYNSANSTWTAESTPSQSAGGPPVIISTDSPTTREDGSPIQNGDLWWDSVSGLMFLYYQDIDSAQWVDSNVTGVPLSTSVYDPIDVKRYGAKGDGFTDDTAAIQSALNSSNKGVYFPPGNYRVAATASGGNSNLVPILTSSVSDRKIWGNGAYITATSNVYKVFTITGDRTEFSLNCEGNSNIGVFTQFECENPFIHDCIIRNLRVGETTNSKTIAINVIMDGINTGFTVINNVINDVYAKGDGVNGFGAGMARAINFEADAEITEPILISNNNINLVHGEEGDAISIFNNNTNLTNILISNNQITDFNRRGIKVKLSGAQILGNHFQNNWTSKPSPNAQGAIDLTDGDRHVVSTNVFTNISYMNNIKMQEESVPSNNCVISDNVVKQINTNSTNSALSFITQGSNWVIRGNVINCPGWGGDGIKLQETTNTIFSGNCVISNGRAFVVSISGTNNTNLVEGNNLSITA